MSIESLKTLACQENWTKVDRIIPKIADKHDYLYHAGLWLYDTDCNLRDLGASILEATSRPIVPYVHRLFENLFDSHKYARFRAACALEKHKYSFPQTQSIIEEGLQDPDLHPIASKYSRRHSSIMAL